MLCVDGVCCDKPWTGPDELCDLPGREGTCPLAKAAAPALSGTVKPVALGVLLLIAALGLRRRRFDCARAAPVKPSSRRASLRTSM